MSPLRLNISPYSVRATVKGLAISSADHSGDLLNSYDSEDESSEDGEVAGDDRNTSGAGLCPRIRRLYDRALIFLVSGPNKSSGSTMYLAFHPQHLIFAHTQRILEQACFDHMKHRLPHVLEENGWEHASQIELSHWAYLLMDNSDALGLDRQLFDQGVMVADMQFLCDIRRIAVRREHPPAEITRRLLNAAVLLLTAFGDSVSGSTSAVLKMEVESAEKVMYDEGLKMMAVAKEDFRRQRKELKSELKKKERETQTEILEQISKEDPISSLLSKSSRETLLSAAAALGIDGQWDSGLSAPAQLQEGDDHRLSGEPQLQKGKSHQVSEFPQLGFLKWSLGPCTHPQADTVTKTLALPEMGIGTSPACLAPCRRMLGRLNGVSSSVTPISTMICLISRLGDLLLSI